MVAGLGFLEVAGVIEHVGRTTAPDSLRRDQPCSVRCAIAAYGQRGTEEGDPSGRGRGGEDPDRRAGRGRGRRSGRSTARRDAGTGVGLAARRAPRPACRPAEIADQILVLGDDARGTRPSFIVDRQCEVASRSSALVTTTSGMPEATLTLSGVRARTPTGCSGDLGQGDPRSSSSSISGRTRRSAASPSASAMRRSRSRPSTRRPASNSTSRLRCSSP